MIGLRFFPLKSADVRGAGTHDERLRTSAWEAMVSWNSVLMPKVQEPIMMLRLTATRNCKVSSQLSFAPNDKLVRAGMNNCGFETVDMA